jgi:hypothetical protein
MNGYNVNNTRRETEGISENKINELKTNSEKLVR